MIELLISFKGFSQLERKSISLRLVAVSTLKHSVEGIN